MDFVSRLLSLVNQKGITKNKVLTDLGLGKNSFVNWQERGTIPNGETLSKLAEYFDVSIDYLLGNISIVEENTRKLNKMGEDYANSEEVISRNEDLIELIKKIRPSEMEERIAEFINKYGEDLEKLIEVMKRLTPENQRKVVEFARFQASQQNQNTDKLN